MAVAGAGTDMAATGAGTDYGGEWGGRVVAADMAVAGAGTVMVADGAVVVRAGMAAGGGERAARRLVYLV
jgi:hypothetical protein